MLIGRYPALLDASVLGCALLRGALMYFANERLLQPHWTADVLKDVELALSDPAGAARGFQIQFESMREAFPAGEIDGYEMLAPVLPVDRDQDKRILAAAITGRCSGIITANLKNFPNEAVAPFNIEVVHPDDFIVNIIDLNPGRALEACRRHREAMNAAAGSPEKYLARYEAVGLIQAHGRLKANVGLL